MAPVLVPAFLPFFPLLLYFPLVSAVAQKLVRSLCLLAVSQISDYQSFYFLPTSYHQQFFPQKLYYLIGYPYRYPLYQQKNLSSFSASDTFLRSSGLNFLLYNKFICIQTDLSMVRYSHFDFMKVLTQLECPE